MLISATLLSRLKESVNELIPECAIHVDSEAPVWSEVGAADIERLHTYLSLKYPEAGVRHWRVRGWGLLIWQPIYLAVIAAHTCEMILPMSGLGQKFSLSGIPSGVCFKHCRFTCAESRECVKRMAEDLAIGCRKVYDSWSGSGLTRKNADRVVADCVLSALLMVYPRRIEEVEALGDLWLASMELQGAAEFIRYKNDSGEYRLALHKKNCCFKYLCRGCAPCDVCPRQTMAERLQRLCAVSA